MSDESPGYEVGYGRPPRHSRWRKGQSGNPRGRPKRKTLAQAVSAALYEKVTVTENGRRRSISKLEALSKQLVNKSASGDMRATKLLTDFVMALELNARSEGETTPAMTHEDREVLDGVMRRIKSYQKGDDDL